MDLYNPLQNKYPLDLVLIYHHQQLDKSLMSAVDNYKRFFYLQMYGNELEVYQPLRADHIRVVIPQALQYPAIR